MTSTTVGSTLHHKSSMASSSSDSLASSPEEVTVRLPNFYQTFLKKEPIVNQHYEAVGLVSQQWMSR